MDKKFIVYISLRSDGRYSVDIEVGEGEGLRDGVLSAQYEDITSVMHAVTTEAITFYHPEPVQTDSAVAPKRATPAQWFEWFYSNADFGPAHSDVLAELRERFIIYTGLLLPDGYDDE